MPVTDLAFGIAERRHYRRQALARKIQVREILNRRRPTQSHGGNLGRDRLHSRQGMI